jgi:hypothetical protein
MKLHNALGAAVGLFALSGVANAAIVQYAITSGNWASLNQWTAVSPGASSLTFDNGDPPCATTATTRMALGTAPGRPGQ